MIRFKCPHCGKSISVKEAAAGRHGKCPDCGERVTVPEAIGQDEPIVAEIADIPARLSPQLPAGQYAAFAQPLGIASLAVGILSLAVGTLSFFILWLPFIGAFLSVLGLLLGIGGLVLVSSQKGSGIGFSIAGVAVNCVAALLMGSVMSLQETASSVTEEDATRNATEGNGVLPSVPQRNAIAFEDIPRELDSPGDEQLTRLQRNEKREAKLASIRSKAAVDWEGFVLQAGEEGTFTTVYYLEIDMASERDGDIDVYLYVTKQQAMRPKIGQRIKFSGPVRGLNFELVGRNIVEVSCENMNILDE